MNHRDPVCGKKMNPNKAHAHVQHEGTTYLLCCPLCQKTFESDRRKYAEQGREATKQRGRKVR